jgi:hypothetical protein
VTVPAPIPLDEFEAAVRSLDRETFVAFVASLWSETADHVTVDSPVVTIRTEDARTALLVDPPESDSDPLDVDGVDGVVTARDVPPDLDVDVVTAADLRQRLLYALPAEDGEAACERFLDAPARSTSYDREQPGAEATDSVEPEAERSGGHEPGTLDDASGGDAETAISDGRPAQGSRRSASAGAIGRGVSGGTDPVSTGDTGRPASSDTGRPASDDAGRSPEENKTIQIRSEVAVAVLLAAVVLAGGAGAVGLADTPIDAASEALGAGGDATDAPSADAAGVNDSDTDSDASETDGQSSTTDDPEPSDTASTELAFKRDEAARNTGLAPNCERSYLHVVQIQMNALKYNNETMNDGIRTTRRFASPRNRQAVSSVRRFIEIFESPSYAPMLSYDSVRYTPLGADDDSAEVRVTTNENGSVTGQYEFRLRKINTTQYSERGGCWMTDAVSVTESE